MMKIGVVISPVHWNHILVILSITYGCLCSKSTADSVISVNTNCTRDLFHINAVLEKPFKGIIFAKDFMDECKTKGNHTSSVELILPIGGCGVRSEYRQDGTYEFSVKLVIQKDERLQQSADIEILAKCTMPDSEMSLNLHTEDGKKSFRNGRMHPNPSQRVRVWLELGGNNGIGSVEVGQPTTLAVRAVLPGNVGVRVVDCAALDGIGESSQKLLDERGCAVDEQVMPSLFIRFRPIDEGWSKPNSDDIVEKLFTATFPAFKFPDRERLHVNCGVQLCKGTCPTVNCKIDNKWELDASKQLGRVEVYNSLSVTAPQIELDSLRSNGGFNVSVDELRTNVRRSHADGILCISSSKLALSFCILGTIFLIAVIVSVCCLLRSRMKASTGLAASASIFSSSLSSQSRFGSKLFVPYGGTLPYGRVY